MEKILMAILKQCLFGNPSGRLGDFVYYTRNGKNIVSLRPISKKICYSEKIVKARIRFGLFSRLCYAMNQDFMIKAVWKEFPITGYSNHNKQIKINYSLFTSEADLPAIQIFPNNPSFTAEAVESVLDEGILSITVNLSPEAARIAEMVYPEISLHGVIKLSDNADEGAKPVKFLPLTSAGVPFVKNTLIVFRTTLLGENLLNVKDYPIKEFRAALVIHNQNGGAAFFSGSLNNMF
jgi:hypothetical protein